MISCSSSIIHIVQNLGEKPGKFSWGQIIEGFVCCTKEGIFKIPVKSKELNKDFRVGCDD